MAPIIPGVAWWPGKIKPGTVTDDMVVGFDLFPTFADVAGITDQLPDNLDGISVKNLLLACAKVPDRDISFGYEPKLGTALRRGDWKLIVKDMLHAINRFMETVTPCS